MYVSRRSGFGYTDIYRYTRDVPGGDQTTPFGSYRLLSARPAIALDRGADGSHTPK